MSGLHSKLGFRVEELKPKPGRPIQGSSIPLILTNDLKYNASNGVVEKVQWFRRRSLQVVPEALELLETIEEPVSVLAICGPCRTGKSYILSRLLGTADAFDLGHSMAPQTFGIWMGTKVLRGKDFTIVLLEPQGKDAVGANADQDASVLVMTILLSSKLIYNSLNVPYKGDLERMQCFIKLARGITVKQGETASQSQFREFFPDFLWLVRDVSLKMQDKDGKDMDPTEYLVTRVLSCNPDAFEESASDKVGRAILTFFPSVECAILERPSDDANVMNNIAQHTDSLNPRFKEGVEKLIERLLRTSHVKRSYDKVSVVNGVALSIMTKHYLEAVNDPDSIPALENTWLYTVRHMQGRAFEGVAMYKQRLMEEQQKAREAELKAREQARELQQLTKQVQDMQRAHLRMDQQHKEQMEKVKREIEERHALELQRVRDARMKNKLSVTVDDNFPVIEFERLDFPAQSYLGHGGFAAVAKARHRDWKQDVAVKRLLPQPTEGSERPLLYSEARKLNLGGRSTCIISLLGVCLEPHFAIVMPYMENGSLAELLRDVDVPWALRWRMAHEISLGMTFLHCQNPQILHCDLKAENVLLDEDYHVKISDFGLSKWKTTSRIVTGTSPTGGTLTHAPPEFIIDINSVPTTKFDVYSFAVLLWEVITRKKPYENAMNSALIELAVKTGQRPDMRLVPANVPDVERVSQLMQTCWSQNPDNRPTFQECEDQLRDLKSKFSKGTFYAAIIYIMEIKACTK